MARNRTRAGFEELVFPFTVWDGVESDEDEGLLFHAVPRPHRGHAVLLRASDERVGPDASRWMAG